MMKLKHSDLEAGIFTSHFARYRIYQSKHRKHIDPVTIGRGITESQPTGDSINLPLHIIVIKNETKKYHFKV